MALAPEAVEPLLEAGRLLSSQLELSKLLQSVLALGAKVVGAETASLLLLDEKTQELYFHVALGLDPAAAGLRLKLGQGIAGSVAQTRRPAVINDVRADHRWSTAMDSRSGFTTRSILAVPLLFKGGLIGVLEAINKRGGAFDEADASAFEAFASQAAVAIQNARLFASFREESFKLNTVFSEMTDAAILCEEGGSILLANSAARRLMGVGETPGTITAALEGFALSPALPELLKAEAPTREFSAERKNPKLLILAGTITKLQDGGWLCVFRDETEKRQRENLKRTFLSLISHKLKTPLCAVMGFADVLDDELRGKPGLEAAQKAAGTVLKESRKLGGLVDKLLRYTTLESGEVPMASAPCAVDAVVEDALKDLGDWLSQQNARVEKPAASGLTVTGDAERLREALKDLIENAVKFNSQPVKTVKISVNQDARHVTLRVADTGPGITPEDQQDVFSRFHQIEAFFTGQVGGLGLGLPYVKKVVEKHGGQVELQSRLGQGTTVTLKLPRSPAA